MRKNYLCNHFFVTAITALKEIKNFTWNMIRKSISATRIELAHVASEKKKIWGFAGFLWGFLFFLLLVLEVFVVVVVVLLVIKKV